MMSEELQIRQPTTYGSWHFIPSHLTKGLVASGISLVFAAYAVWEFSQVEAVEVRAMVIGH
jgi:hypothetical protein